METTTENTEQINLVELQNYHRELFIEMFGESEAGLEWFGLLWRKFKDELVFEMLKQKSKYFQS